MDNLFEEMSFGMADPDYYFPLAEAGRDTKQYIPNVEMPSWKSTVEDVWRTWSPPRAKFFPSAGWKIHISSTIADADTTLDRVARACISFQTAFKHLANEFYFMWLHQKYASRSQSGKFVAIYPRNTEEAHSLLEHLSLEFENRSGPYILSDRRYKNSHVVHYRYGAFCKIISFDPVTGKKLYVMPGVNGTLIEDKRRALDKYLIATDSGYRVLGDFGRRYSADIWSGSSGIIRSLDALVRGPQFQYLPPSSDGVLKAWLSQINNGIGGR